jgi:hypothetical protein
MAARPLHPDFVPLSALRHLPVNPESPNTPTPHGEEELPPPTGTLFLLMLYIMVMAGMWFAIYFDFVGR